MPIIDSKTNNVIKQLSESELVEQAALMRGYCLTSLCLAGSGHSGGSLSAMDIAAALYLNVANLDPKNYAWDKRDRIIFSAGHKAPALYTGLAFAGFYDPKQMALLRKYKSQFQGHPDWRKLDGVEVSTGSLGQGISVAVGIAIAAKLNKENHKIFCMTGDGEHQEGQVWEAIMEAAHYKLDNFIVIVDINRLQIDGNVCDVMNIQPLKEKYQAFDWDVIEIDGHNMHEILEAFQKAKSAKKPVAILANTIKGKGVSFMENAAGWHGKSPNAEELQKALVELRVADKVPVEEMKQIADNYQNTITAEIESAMPKFSHNYWWNKENTMKAQMTATRMGFGKALQETGDDERVVCLGADISGSITISQFYEKNPERKQRFLSMGIAEQSATCVAAGLAKEGKLPVFGTYGVFASARNADQLRTTVCYGNHNVFIAGAHGGISVGPDGATHQSLEELYQVCALPNMNVVVPCDSVETEKATKELLLHIVGPKYMRFAREATPVVTTKETPFVFGKANVIRYRGKKDNFIDAFETVLASAYMNENEDITIIACGPMVPEAMRAAYILKEEFNIETRIINMHTVKPLDKEAILRAALETNNIITAEEHQIGGLGNRVAAVVAEKISDAVVKMIGVNDRFGGSGAPWELVKAFGLTAEHLAEKSKKLVQSR
jgi:transketolase